jgi:hypothetical protein
MYNRIVLSSHSKIPIYCLALTRSVTELRRARQVAVHSPPHAGGRYHASATAPPNAFRRGPEDYLISVPQPGDRRPSAQIRPNIARGAPLSCAVLTANRWKPEITLKEAIS